VSQPVRITPSPRPRAPVPPDPTPSPVTPVPAAPEQPRSRASTIWYQVQAWTLGLLALLVVAFMVSAILLATWPNLAGAYKPMVKDENTVVQPDRRQMRERWKYEGNGGPPAGRTPRDDWKNRSSVVPRTSPKATPSATPEG
jgi:hypothetical protein